MTEPDVGVPAAEAERPDLQAPVARAQPDAARPRVGLLAEPTPGPALRVLGVRHHGPGSARAVRRALERQRPQVVLVEGPADADDLVRFVPDLEPPVALLGWRKDELGRAGFWPFAVFSPEWQALDWATRNGVPVRFIDLPTWAVLEPGASEPETVVDGDEPSDGGEPDGAMPTDAAPPDAVPTNAAPPSAVPTAAAPLDAGGARGAAGGSDTDAEFGVPTPPPAPVRNDPIARLARAAGYDDPEAWWEDVVELGRRQDVATPACARPVVQWGDAPECNDDDEPAATAEEPFEPADDASDPFDALIEAMVELRLDLPETDPETLLREAHMRRALRAATKEFDRVAVVCGAWHAPALTGKLPPASADNALLKALPTGAARRSTELTWVPWTHSRLAQASGYGAGVDAPGWYHHLFTVPDEPIVRWLTRVGSVLRRHDLPVSSAHVIEATRLAEALAGLRGRPMPGLPEVTEATWSVLCDGNPVTLELVSREAVVGEAMGEVPDTVPMVPLDADLRASVKRLRLKIDAVEKVVTLDLRKPNDLARSQLFHRLGILRIGWATALEARTQGTFKEAWRLVWAPELSVRVVEASVHGTTIVGAASSVLTQELTTLASVTRAIERALTADLPDALQRLLDALDEQAARESDIQHLLAALPPLARASRYGDVRRTDTDRLAHVAGDVLARACAGLGVAASGADADAANQLRAHIDEVQAVMSLLGAASQQLWTDTLLSVLGRHDLPGVLAGRLTRLLTDAGVLDTGQAESRLSLALSGGTPAEWQAAWIDGFLSGSVLLLLYEPRLLRILHAWVSSLGDDAFVDVLPVVRRAFGQWDAVTRRKLAARVAALDAPDTASGDHPGDDDLTGDEPVLATVALILGATA